MVNIGSFSIIGKNSKIKPIFWYSVIVIPCFYSTQNISNHTIFRAQTGLLVDQKISMFGFVLCTAGNVFFFFTFSTSPGGSWSSPFSPPTRNTAHLLDDVHLRPPVTSTWPSPLQATATSALQAYPHKTDASNLQRIKLFLKFAQPKLEHPLHAWINDPLSFHLHL